MPKAGQIYHKRPDIEKSIYYAQACKAGNMLFVSGCVSWDAEGNIIGAGDMKAQITQVYTDIKETVFAIDMEALLANKDIRTRFYEEAASAPPAATWIGCSSLAVPDTMIEVECIALLD